MASVSNGVPLTAFVIGRFCFFVVSVVAERRGAKEPHRAHLVSIGRGAIVASNAKSGRINATNTAWMREPLMGCDPCPRSFARCVHFVNNRAEPIEHGLFRCDRAWARSMQNKSEARDIE